MKNPKHSKSKVLIIDSGVGGLTILNESIKLNPNLDYYYFADYKSLPYGTKSPAVIRKSLMNNLTLLQEKFDFDVLVLGCNTLTAVAVDFLRRLYPDKIIIGTEPAIKVAIKNQKTNILLLATPNTIKYNKLINQCKEDKNLNLQLKPMATLADLIEHNIGNLKELRPAIYKLLGDYTGYIDSIVLGCTHYIYLSKMIREYSQVPVFDGNFGVIKQIQKKTNPKKKAGKVYVLTNDIKKNDNLLKAWGILQSEGVRECAELLAT